MPLTIESRDHAVSHSLGLEHKMAQKKRKLNPAPPNNRHSKRVMMEKTLTVQRMVSMLDQSFVHHQEQV